MSTSINIVGEVLEDEEVQNAVRKGLKALALDSPEVFVKLFVMPLTPKFSKVSAEPLFEEMTPSQMDMLTSPEEYRKAGDAIFAEINKH